MDDTTVLRKLSQIVCPLVAGYSKDNKSYLRRVGSKKLFSKMVSLILGRSITLLWVQVLILLVGLN